MTAALVLQLTRLYLEPQRQYHGLHHITAMLQAGRAMPLDDEQTMAVWFHDAIYDPRSRTNEEDSAALAARALAAEGWRREAIDRVCRIVLDTKQHVPTTPGAAAVLDLDLMSLAAPWAEFAQNTARIRAEYAHLPEADFTAGRRAFFTTMLQRPRLFHTEFGAKLEAAARQNMLRAMQS
jgi:predicted metal-dependent HD superfamily phosphohydrolase